MRSLSRRERIEVLLDHWPDFFETAVRDGGSSGDGGVFLLPGMSRHPSVVELGRALGALRVVAPNKSAHLFAFYSSPFRNVDRKRRVMSKGRFHLVEERVRERVPPPWVRLQKVRDALALVAQEPRSVLEAERRPWCFRGDVFIPAPLLEKVPGLTPGELGELPEVAA